MKLAVDVMQVNFDGVIRDAQGSCDLLVGVTLDYALHDRVLTHCELRKFVRLRLGR